MSRLKAEELLLALDVVREVQAAPDLDAYARNHIAHVYEKLGVRNRAAAVAAVLRAESAL